VAATPSDLFAAEDPGVEVSFERVNPTLYRARVRTEGPAVLVLAETYDPLWTVSGPGLEVGSVPVYGVTNGFAVDRSGTFEVTIEYEPQQSARLGQLLSGIMVMVSGPLLLVLRQRGRDD
jgi:hypothetical protein